MSRWFRMYNEVVDDPKVQALHGNDFKGWVNLLCLACRRDGFLPPLEDIAFALRLNLASTKRLLKMLESRGLIDRIETDDCYGRPHGWDDRQFKSDVSTDRVKRFRNAKRNVSRNVSSDVAVTPPDTESETDTEYPSQKEGKVTESEVIHWPGAAR